MDLIYSIDFGILDFLQNTIRCTFLDKLFAVLTHMGDAGLIWIVLSIVLLCFKKYRRCGILMLVSLAVCAIFTSGIIKPLAGRIRPFAQRGLEPYITPPSGYSFPSGHTSSSFTAATTLLLCHKKEGYPAAVLASLVAFSRLYFYVHFPTDVLAGALLGILCAVIVNKCADKLVFNKK